MAFIPMAAAPGGEQDMLRRAMMAQLLQQRGAPTGVADAMTEVGRVIGLALANRGVGARDAERQQALIDALGGKPGAAELGATLPGAEGGLQGLTRGAPTPGMLPELSRQEIQALVLAGQGPALLEQATRRKFETPAAPEAPKTRDVIQGDERVFQEWNPQQEKWIEVGRGAAFSPPPQVNVNTAPKLPAPPQGQQYVEDQAAPGGYRLAPIEGFTPDVQGPSAAVMSLAPGAIAELPNIREALFPGGKFDRMTAGKMLVPGTDAAGYANSFLAGTMAILRGESGGAITETEIANKLKTYQPSVLDSEAVAQQKIERYERDLKKSLETAQRGRGEAPPPVPAPAASSAAPSPVDQAIEGAVSTVREAFSGGAASDWSKATLDQLLSADIAKLGAEAREAISRRLAELGY